MPFIPGAIDQLLVEADLSQEELGDQLGVPASTIFRWLHGKNTPRIENLDALYGISDVYGLVIDFYVLPE